MRGRHGNLSLTKIYEIMERSVKKDKEVVKNDIRFIRFTQECENIYQAYKGHTWPRYIAGLADPIVAEILGLEKSHYTKQIAIGCLYDLNLN